MFCLDLYVPAYMPGMNIPECQSPRECRTKKNFSFISQIMAVSHTSEQTGTTFGCYKFLIDGVQRAQKHYSSHYVTLLLSVDFFNFYYLFYDIYPMRSKKSEYKA